MNLLGKILTVFIIIVSIALMIFSIVVYSTHRNWEQVNQEVSTALQNERQLNEKLKSQTRTLESQLRNEMVSAQQEVLKLESERVALLSETDALQQALAQARRKEGDTTKKVADTQEKNEQLAAEVADLRKQFRETHEARDQAFAETVNATEEAHQLQGQYSSVLERNKQLKQEAAAEGI